MTSKLNYDTPPPSLSLSSLQTVPKAAKEAYPFFYTQTFEKKNAGPMENGSDPVVVCQVGKEGRRERRREGWREGERRSL